MGNNNSIYFRKFALALLLCIIFIPVSRTLSPQAIIDNHGIHLAWLPMSVMMSMMLLFGRHAVLPLIIGFAITNCWYFDLSLVQAALLLFCQLSAFLAICVVVRWRLGPRWRFGLPNWHMGERIFWFGFVAPILLKGTMYLTGEYLDYPVSVSPYFASASAIYTIVDVQSLIGAVLIFTMLFYFPLRVILNPRYARVLWRKSTGTLLLPGNRLFAFSWLCGLALVVAALCLPISSGYIAGYLVPIIFILFTVGIRKLSYPVLSLSWALCALLLLASNNNFLHGVSTEYALAFVLSVLISFSICLLYMLNIFQHSQRIRRKWHAQALTDPLTGLPNLRALEASLTDVQQASLCCLRMANLEFLSRHYGMMMRVHCKRLVVRHLQSLLQPGEKAFQMPGSELALVLYGPETAQRLSHIVNMLNHVKFGWHNAVLELEFGAAWDVIDGNDSDLHHTLGQLSWLAEQACESRRVLALNNSMGTVSGQTTERVLLLGQIKRALAEDGLVLYAQPIRDAAGKGYDEILTRLVCDGEIIMPDRFIPVVAQFNLSRRFDMLVIEKVCRWIQANPQFRCSVNLLPFTLMHKESAARIIALFRLYNVRAENVIVEITEEQAFSNSEVSVQNIQMLRDYGCKIAIDDFGTGYANYERLKRLQADIIKIDGCFVKEIATDAMDAMIVKSICELAKAKSLSVVAEYVETETQREMLLALGVDYLQGYLLGKPTPLS
ncbi:EAL domain-containing protein (putative c-di-GMP-specific phosphodiesterase class I) [Enterobacter sp. BIGb0383]|uniref:sensor domain-containing phosphodiesterase n=1 Tax=unclassified Enterobacter TaxID=2608935 RepID=UPI000F489329|nr:MULTISPECIES: EAL domain-containing protein [unclassified Enterobacter]ROP63007.1 EAL domain-containing protein (putative c-di-GMP-specific phosphodiesterase class I) [Enterobacter sp. BIGb0383]ROS13168.1 EAL domain-containing protein (putative c-di-GMP-specific phosphodiesterase class I) [Enterobacter sp. BIGb0359]